MLQLTPQEKKVLASLLLIVWSGYAFHFLLNRYPRLGQCLHHAEQLTMTVNINRAGKEELLQVPYLGERTATQILQSRREKGHFKSVEELKIRLNISPKKFQRFKPFLKI